MTHRSLSIAIAMTLTIVGCSSFEPRDDERTETSTAALVAGVPKKEWVALAVAEFDPAGMKASSVPSSTPIAGCTANGKAGLADLSMTISGRANGMLGGVLQLVSDFTKLPPSSQGPNDAT